MAAERIGGVGASGELALRVAQVRGSVLAVMRSRRTLCDAQSVTHRCLIVDDNRLFLDSATTLLERQGLTIVGVASTSADALRKAEKLRPDLVLVDVSLGEEDGFELAHRLVAGHLRDATVILISTSLEGDLADQVALSPAAGFLTKSELSADAIRAFLDGG